MFHLNHTCTVQRASVTTDRYGNEKRSYSDDSTLVPCRLITTMEKHADPITGQVITAAAYKLLLAPDTDALAGDRVTTIVSRAGTSVAGTYDVIAALPHSGAMARLKTLELEKVS